MAVTLVLFLATSESYGQPPWRIARLPQSKLAPEKPAPSHQTYVGTYTDEQFNRTLDRAIEVTGKRHLTGKPALASQNPHSPWQIFHCVLAMRRESVLRVGNEKVNAIDWISKSEPQFANEPWLLLTQHGAKFHPYTQKYYFEGHPGQFMALLSHSNLPVEHEFRVQGKTVKLSDMLNNLQKEVNDKEEVTWILWALQHYLAPDAEWVNQHNEKWSIERLVQIESALPVVNAPCGGNHRLFALTRARDKYLSSGKRLKGVWLLADQKIKQHIEIAKSLQNADGSFSNDSYKGPAHTNDVNQRFNTTGHTMEFLSISLPSERLNELWVRNAVWTLSRELITHQKTEIDCGPLFHTLNALILYRDRIRAKATSPAPSIALELPPKSTPAIAPPLETALKTAPEPVQVTAPSASTRANAPAIEIPAETKPSELFEAPIEIPVPDPLSIPESKPIDTGAGKPADATDILTEAPQTKAAATLPKTAIPRVDPSQLGNIGKPAPSLSKPEQRRTLPPRTAVRERITSPGPALLPVQSATPLKEIETGCGEPVPSTEKKSIHPLSDVKASIDRPLQEAAMLLPSVDSEPASALEPINL